MSSATRRTLAILLLFAATLLTLPACQRPSEESPDLRPAAQAIQSQARSSATQLGANRLRIGGTLDATEVCACLRVCSESGKCTACSCSPENCGSCD
jgi:hypothetical protein